MRTNTAFVRRAFTLLNALENLNLLNGLIEIRVFGKLSNCIKR